MDYSLWEIYDCTWQEEERTASSFRLWDFQRVCTVREYSFTPCNFTSNKLLSVNCAIVARQHLNISWQFARKSGSAFGGPAAQGDCEISIRLMKGVGVEVGGGGGGCDYCIFLFWTVRKWVFFFLSETYPHRRLVKTHAGSVNNNGIVGCVIHAFYWPAVLRMMA